MAGLILCVLLALLPRALAASEFDPASVVKGVFLVASPSLNDPNFRQTVVLVLEHGAQGTLGIILNRPTDILLSQALPDVAALKGTNHRLFAGGPVQPSAMLLLSRLNEPQPGMRLVFDSVYVGGTPELLERIMAKAAPADRFRAFAGYAGWAPGQLGLEMRQGAWAVLSPESNLFEQDPSILWQESLTRLEAPRVISN
ncbi:MAG TPA: YqgE/AlgH family protein [Nitrospira sp.]|jgi:putative transcriptional regulator|nr:YqgE/AlgH family protein [Nitrospira sp.]